jgi:hypothetical protein
LHSSRSFIYRDNCIDPGIEFIEKYNCNLRRLKMIKKVKGGYKVTSEKGKNLGGPYKTREEAAKRLRQVEFFKHNKG